MKRFPQRTRVGRLINSLNMKKKVLVIDIGGTNVKVFVPGQQEPRKIPSGTSMTPLKMVEAIRKEISSQRYHCISMGYPGVVREYKILTEPHNLAKGWVGFDFKNAFGVPVRIINDAAMQALGSYQGKRMLFLGLGTGLGSAMILDDVIQPLELAHLPYRKDRTYEEYLGADGLERLGKNKWREHVERVVEKFQAALQVDYVVLGGGNARLIQKLPPQTILGKNENAFEGGLRLWKS